MALCTASRIFLFIDSVLLSYDEDMPRGMPVHYQTIMFLKILELECMESGRYALTSILFTFQCFFVRLEGSDDERHEKGRLRETALNLVNVTCACACS